VRHARGEFARPWLDGGFVPVDECCVLARAVGLYGRRKVLLNITMHRDSVSLGNVRVWWTYGVYVDRDVQGCAPPHRASKYRTESRDGPFHIVAIELQLFGEVESYAFLAAEYQFTYGELVAHSMSTANGCIVVRAKE
jgi:hypothetical protein